VPIYVRLLDEGTPTSRPTHAERIGNDLFKLLPTPNYDPNDERWEFPPGSIVRAKTMEYDGKDYLLAVTPSNHARKKSAPTHDCLGSGAFDALSLGALAAEQRPKPQEMAIV
jgi:hypothetical protein